MLLVAEFAPALVSMTSMFETADLDAAANQKEVDLTTFGRRTGAPSRRTIWITSDGPRLYIRSGQGLGRDWPQNLLANGRAILHLEGRDVPVRARHVTDPAEARGSLTAVKSKYGVDFTGSKEGEPLTPPESATFELLPDAAAA
jgi:deazaflavin-dependent oxidoreductase (nitroreductase family)